jgi:glycosidase
MIKPVIYQLVVRYFGNTNTTNRRDGTLEQNGCGKFADIDTAALRGIQELGVTHVWLTGCIRQATLTDYSQLGMPADDPDVVKGRAGSFYAIRDYFDVCPDYALDPASRMAEFEALVERLHAAGLKVLLDFVPNHVARGYHSVVRPELDFGLGDDQSRFFARDNHFFYLRRNGGQGLRLTKPEYWQPEGVTFDGAFAPEDGSPGHVPKATGNNGISPSPSVNDWYETVKLNYGFDFVDRTIEYAPRPRTWESMNEIIAYWQAKGVDGFRCDFAHYVPQEFWTYLLAQARERQPGAFFIAEAYPFPWSGDPIGEMAQLIAAGFDGVYYDAAYDGLRAIYQGTASQDDYDRLVVSPPIPAEKLVQYLENHDERRIASPIVFNTGADHTGFGAAEAGYQLAPLQLLHSRGPVLIYNGQEVGEPGLGIEGFHTNEARTTFFDYWAMPEFVKWVNGHAYDGGGLSPEQQALRRFYAALGKLCQDPAVRGDGHWGLKYYNRPDRFADCPHDLYSFARFHSGAPGRLLVIVSNFRPLYGTAGPIRIPRELASAAALPDLLEVRLILDRDGTQDTPVAEVTAARLASEGFPVNVPVQSAQVFEVVGRS